MEFKIIEKAGLTQREFGDICSVSRTTVNLWVNGRMKPHRYIQSRVKEKLEQVARAVENGKLPTAHAAGPARQQAITSALKPTLRAA